MEYRGSTTPFPSLPKEGNLLLPSSYKWILVLPSSSEEGLGVVGGLRRLLADAGGLGSWRRKVRPEPVRLTRVAVEQCPEKHVQRVEQAPVSTLNEITRQTNQPQMAGRVPFSPRLGRFSLAGADQVHKALAGGCDHALHARKVLGVVLEELGHGHLEGVRYLAKSLGPRFEVTVFDSRKIRPGNAAPLA